jgi:hypothetical protein
LPFDDCSRSSRGPIAPSHFHLYRSRFLFNLYDRLKREYLFSGGLVDDPGYAEPSSGWLGMRNVSSLGLADRFDFLGLSYKAGGPLAGRSSNVGCTGVKDETAISGAVRFLQGRLVIFLGNRTFASTTSRWFNSSSQWRLNSTSKQHFFFIVFLYCIIFHSFSLVACT